MTKELYAQRLASVLAVQLAKIDASPNHVTAVSLLFGLAGAGFFALGEPWAANLGAGLFVIARFLDSVDGRLAVVADRRTKFGYYFDYVTGVLCYSALFAGMGIGLAGGPLGSWTYAVGAAGVTSAIVSAFLNHSLDRLSGLGESESVGYPVFGGFSLEDGIFLIAPVTWIGWLTPFFVLAGIGATIYCLWTLGRLLVTRRQRRSRVRPTASRPGGAKTGSA